MEFHAIGWKSKKHPMLVCTVCFICHVKVIWSSICEYMNNGLTNTLHAYSYVNSTLWSLNLICVLTAVYSHAMRTCALRLFVVPAELQATH